jgi:hypothetical protein
VATVAFPVLLITVLVAGFALAPTPSGRHARHATASERLLPPSGSNATPGVPSAGRAPQATQGAPANERSSASRSGEARRQVGNPERPPPPRSPLGEMLSVARQFSVAYMPYQIGRLPRWVRTAIEETCTTAFAHYLLAHPAQIPPLLNAHPRDVETYQVASVNLAASTNRVSVSYVSEQDRADTGAFLLTLTRRRGHWLVVGLET